MKKLFLIFLVLLKISVKAQLEDITGKFDGNFGYSIPSVRGGKFANGICIAAEPKFWYNDNLVIGAKIGFNFFKTNIEKANLAPITMVCGVAEKYFGDGDLTYFLGASAGLYLGGHISKIDGVPTGGRAPKYLGLAPRAGLQFGKYRLMAEYHMPRNETKFFTFSFGYTFGSE